MGERKIYFTTDAINSGLLGGKNRELSETLDAREVHICKLTL